MKIKNNQYELYPDFFPVGAAVRCELEWLPGKWQRGTVASHKSNSYDMPQWIYIDLENGGEAEYDYRYLDVEDPRNSLVRLIRKEN